ncbi:MAG: RdgB/HAM1 family non-canonical purine NTP pyrophosphatase [Lachnospiraceae bacterium]|nr:RdgB/HAM1 family non-canonical purine NTP pyrophosphatase [Lachnospiraceae bacterium]
MPTRVVFATGNQNKVREVNEILGHDKFEVVSLKDMGITDDAEENGKTFEDNAYIKAKSVWDKVGGYVLADDSGLEIDALPDILGVESARFMGHDTSYDIKNRAILEKMENVPSEKRDARFVCAACVIRPDGSTDTVRGTMEGYIGDHIEGERGFGYDPIFFLREYGCSSASLTDEGKNAISHRGKAMRKIKEII